MSPSWGPQHAGCRSSLKPIPFLAPTFPDPSVVAEDYAQIAARGVYTNGGPVEARFAAGLREYIGPGACVSVVSSCTAGLELAIRAIFPTGRPLVLVPSFTFAAGPLTILRCGFMPLFIDVDRASWQPSIVHAENVIEKSGRDQVAGILLTSTFGVANAEIDLWEELARRRGLPLVIDSAAGFGSKYPWSEPLGLRGTCEVFSFHATKTLAIGEGGCVASKDPEVVARIDQLKNFGFDQSRVSVSAGLNAKLPEISAAIGLRQLEALPARLELRQAILRGYIEAMRTFPVEFQPNADKSALPFISVLMNSEDCRIAAVGNLQTGGIESRTYYGPPVHRHPIFQEAARGTALPKTEEISSRVISLPMADNLDAEAIQRIVAIVGQTLGV